MSRQPPPLDKCPPLRDMWPRTSAPGHVPYPPPSDLVTIADNPPLESRRKNRQLVNCGFRGALVPVPNGSEKKIVLIFNVKNLYAKIWTVLKHTRKIYPIPLIFQNTPMVTVAYWAVVSWPWVDGIVTSDNATSMTSSYHQLLLFEGRRAKCRYEQYL